MTEQVFDARSPGEMLRTAREKQGLHIAALAAAIKVAPRKLDALEHDRWDELPDAVFVRALAQTVCRTLKIDAAPILQLLPRAGAVTLEPGGGYLNAPFKDRPGRDEPGIGLGAVRPMVVAASVLMVAAVVVYFVPERFWSGRFGTTASAPAAQSPVPAASEPAVGPALAASVPEPVVVTEAASVPASAAPMAATEAAPSNPSLVKLRARESSWVDVRDATGRALLSRLVVPGELVDLDGRLPIRLTIGNAAVTQLDFRGQPFDLAPVTRDNVARVELK